MILFIIIIISSISINISISVSMIFSVLLLLAARHTFQRHDTRSISWRFSNAWQRRELIR